jgi:uncharacterized protein
MTHSNLPIFHLAFPVKDISSTLEFYRDRLQLPVDLVEERRCIINLFGHQAVAHVSDKDIPESVSMYPRHFGVILDTEEMYDKFLARARTSGVQFFKNDFSRFPGTPRAHRTFFLQDPSNNLLEFKWYRFSRLFK